MRKNSFWVIAILYFLLSIGNNLIHPITTPFLTEFLHYDSVFFGIYYALMSLGLVIGALICGLLYQKISRRLLIFIGFIGYAVFQFLFGICPINPYITMIWRFFSGLFIAFPNTLFLVFAVDNLEENVRVKGLSILSAINILGVSLGYEIGGLMHDYVFIDRFDMSFYLQVLWCLVCAVLCLIIVDDKKIAEKKENNLIYTIRHLSTKKVLFFVGLLLFSIASVTVSKFFEPFYQSMGIVENPSSSLAHFTLLTGGIGLLCTLFFIPFIHKISISYKKILCTFLLIACACIFIVFSMPDSTILYFFYSVYLLYIVVKYLITPLEQNLTVEDQSSSDFPSLLSLRQSTLSLGQVIGPLFASILFSINMRIPFYVAGSLFALSLIFFMMSFLIKKAK